MLGTYVMHCRKKFLSYVFFFSSYLLFVTTYIWFDWNYSQFLIDTHVRWFLFFLHLLEILFLACLMVLNQLPPFFFFFYFLFRRYLSLSPQLLSFSFFLSSSCFYSKRSWLFFFHSLVSPVLLNWIYLPTYYVVRTSLFSLFLLFLLPILVWNLVCKCIYI